MQVTVRLLGGLGLEVDGHPVAVDDLARRPRELLCLLALAPRARLTRDEAVDALFGHLDPEAGSANLHKAASLVRSGVADRHAVVIDGGWAALWPGAEVTTDVARFEDQARAALAGGDADPATCARVADMYHGELLPRARYEQWSIPRREALARTHRDLLRAAEQWEQLVVADPVDEDAARALMRRYTATGNRAGLVRQFQRLRDALAAELGVRPSPETLRCYEELGTGPAVAAPLAERTPVAGRRKELGRATAAWRKAATGTGGGLVITGEAGIGKTRLAEAVLADASAAGWTTLRGSGSRLDAALPYEPIVEAIDRLLLQRPDLSDRLPAAARGVLATLGAATVDDEAPRDPMDRQHVLSAVARLVAAAARERGVVMLVDDLHAADDDTVDLVHHLVRVASYQRVLVVATVRRGEASPRLASAWRELVDTRRATEIALGPLTPAEADDLLEALPRPVPAEARPGLWARAGGNPFLLRELAGGDTGPAASAVAARLDRLGADLRRALERTAVAGESVTADELAALAGVDDETALSVVDAALASGVLEEVAGAYRFRHGIVREVLVEHLPAHRRAEVHGAAADALAARRAPPARVAHHLLAAGRGHDAVPVLAAAASRALAVGAYQDALGFVEAALAERPDDVDLLTQRADLAFAVGSRGAALAYAEAVAATPAQERGPLLVRQARACVAANDPAGAAAALASGSVTEPADVALRLLVEAQVAWLAGDLGGAERTARRARTAALACGAMGVVFGAMTLRDLVMHQLGRWPDALGGDLLDAGDSPVLAAVVYDAHLCGAEAYLYGGHDYEVVKDFARTLDGTAARAGAGRGRAFAVTLLGEAELLSGDLASAEDHLREAVGLHQAVGAPGGEAVARQRLAEVALGHEQPEEAAELLEDALALARSSPPIAWHMVARIYGTMVRAAPATGPALAVVGEGEAGAGCGMAQACPPCSVGFWIPAAIACAQLGEPDRARRFLTHAEPWVAALWPTTGWRAALDEARGHVSIAEDDVGGGSALLDQAARRFAKVGQPLDARRCRGALASLG